MTTATLLMILASKPRGRVFAIAGRWGTIVFLTPLRWVLKIPAIPFIWLGNILFKMERALMGDVGDILTEKAEKAFLADNDDDTED